MAWWFGDSDLILFASMKFELVLMFILTVI